MSFLAPLFLVGVLAVGLPIVFHLIRRTVRERQVFSSLMFLTPTPPRVTRQSRLENLLLLLLRCLVIGLLALAFSRPFLQSPVDLDPNRADVKHMAVLVDVSASMQREDLWAQAVKQAETLIQQSTPGDIVGLYTFDDRLHPIVSLEQCKAMASDSRKSSLLAALTGLKPGWGRTHLGRSVIAASESLESGGQGTSSPDSLRRIIVITDLAEGSHLDGLQGHEWPKGLAVQFQPVKAAKPTNAGLQLLPERSEDEVAQGAQVRVRVSNSSDARREQFRLLLGPEFTQASPMEVYVPPGQNRVVTLTVRSNQTATVILEGDDAPFDNRLSWTPPTPQHTRMLYIGSDAAADPNQSSYYLQRAFPNTRGRTFEILTRKPEELAQSAGVDEVSLLLCASALTPQQAGQVRGWVEQGKTLFYALPSAEAGAGLGALLGGGDVRVQEAPKRNFTLLGQIDFQHPLFAPFAEARFADFTKIHFWKHRTLTRESLPASASVVAHFDDGSPALVEMAVGKGTVLLLCAGWQPSESQLALSTKFVPLLYSILERSRPSALPAGHLVVGDVIPLSEPAAAGVASTPTRVVRPDGREVSVSGVSYDDTSLPGLYRVGANGARSFVINVPAEESRTAALSLESFEKLGVPMLKELTQEERAAAKDQKRLMAAAELENRQKLWRWLILAGFLFVIGETWLARRTSGAPASA